MDWLAPEGTTAVMVFDQYGEAVTSFGAVVSLATLRALEERSGEYELVLVAFDKWGEPIGDSVPIEEAARQ